MPGDSRLHIKFLKIDPQNCEVPVLPPILKEHGGVKKWDVALPEFSISHVKKMYKIFNVVYPQIVTNCKDVRFYSCLHYKIMIV